MNKTFASFAIVSIMLVVAAEALGPDIKTYYIINDIPGESIEAHCYSRNDDFGNKVLGPGQRFKFTFQVAYFNLTKFHCEFKTKHGSGRYGVYTKSSKEWCAGTECYWYARTTGLCAEGFQKHCQNWKY